MGMGWIAAANPAQRIERARAGTIASRTLRLTWTRHCPGKAAPLPHSRRKRP